MIAYHEVSGLCIKQRKKYIVYKEGRKKYRERRVEFLWSWRWMYVVSAIFIFITLHKKNSFLFPFIVKCQLSCGPTLELDDIVCIPKEAFGDVHVISQINTSPLFSWNLFRCTESVCSLSHFIYKIIDGPLHELGNLDARPSETSYFKMIKPPF